MAGPTHKATGGVNARLFVDGVFVGMVQNANFNRVFQKVAVNEAGNPKTLEHVFNGVVFTLSIGFVHLVTKNLEAQGVVPTDNEDEIINTEGKVFEFRRVNDDRVIVRAEQVTISNDNLNFSRDSVWGRNVNFDATWFRIPR